MKNEWTTLIELELILLQRNAFKFHWWSSQFKFNSFKKIKFKLKKIFIEAEF